MERPTETIPEAIHKAISTGSAQGSEASNLKNDALLQQSSSPTRETLQPGHFSITFGSLTFIIQSEKVPNYIDIAYKPLATETKTTKFTSPTTNVKPQIQKFNAYRIEERQKVNELHKGSKQTAARNRSTSGELPLNPAQPPHLESYRTLLTSHKQEMTAPTTPTLDLTPLHRNVDAPLSDLYPPPFSALINPNQVNAGQSLNKPSFLTPHTLWAVLTPTISQILRAHSAGPLTLTRCSMQPHCEDGLQMLPGNHLFRSDILGPTSQQLQLTRHLLAMSDAVDPTAQQTHELKEPLSSGGHITSYQVTESNRTVQEQNERDQDSETAEMSQLSPILCARAHTVGKKKKGKQIATRRSPRLQAKRSVPHTMAKLSDRAKSLTAKLLFDHTAADAPIDAGTALTILQASGLEITKQVHEMIEVAVIQDTQAEQEEDRSPTTPLHDHIPPLLMPGTDLPL